MWLFNQEMTLILIFGALVLRFSIEAFAEVLDQESPIPFTTNIAEDDSREECLNAADAVNDDVANDGNNKDCTDGHKNCRAWSETGACAKNPAYMLDECPRSCKVCDVEFDEYDFGEWQTIPNHLSDQVKEVISKSIEYMKRVNVDPKYDPVRKKCLNKDENCSMWSIGTGCEDNPTYMKLECGPACQSCDYVLEILENQKLCGLDPEGTDAIEAGGMDALFERMVRVAEHSNWQPTVLSRPTKNMETHEEDNIITHPRNAPTGPWVITLENFVKPNEISAILKWAEDIGYERSRAADKITEYRTSAQAWCVGGCHDDPVVRTVRERIETVTGIPQENYEHLQLLKYGSKQYYQQHNDFIERHKRQAPGTRLLTFFIYFNDVEKGGETRFPLLNNLKVQPRRGRVLIWPSVLDGDLYAVDKRTDHEAAPVEVGQKFAANAWIHARDFQTPFKAGCKL